MFVLEFGKRKAVMLNSDNDTFTYYPNYESVLNVPFEIPKGGDLTIEYSHMGVAKTEGEKKQSKAVIFNREQLSKFYQDCKSQEIDLRFFPQQMTYDARVYAGYKDDKSEENDARAMHKWLIDFPNCWNALKRPSQFFDTRAIVEEGWLMKESIGDLLNRLRDEFTIQKTATSTLSWYDNPKLPAYQFIEKHLKELIDGMQDDFHKEPFGFTNTQKNNPNKLYANAVKRQPIATLYHCMVDLDGSLITRPSTGAIAGQKFWEQHICPHKPYSRRGGVCRSNIYHFGLHAWLQGKIAATKGTDYHKAPSLYMLTKEEKLQANEWRQQYMNSIDKMYSLIKRIVEKEHNL